MTKFTIRSVRENLRAILDSVENGEEVTITRRGREIAHLVPVSTQPKPLPGLGAFRAGMRVKGVALSRTVTLSRNEGRF